MESTGRGGGHLTGITIPKASSSEICENHRAGALSWNPLGGGTNLEWQPLKGPPQISVRTIGREHSIGITIPKASSSEICENHRAGALRLNPQDRALNCHKGTPFDHVSLMISTNQKPGFLALSQWEALILQKFMSTFHTKTILTDLWEPQDGATKLEINYISYTHLILKADVCLALAWMCLTWSMKLNVSGGGTELDFNDAPYTHLILKSGLCLTLASIMCLAGALNLN